MECVKLLHLSDLHIGKRVNECYVINRKGEEIYNQPLAREVTEAFVAWCKEIEIGRASCRERVSSPV